jgi:hypothetical protein
MRNDMLRMGEGGWQRKLQTVEAEGTGEFS